MQFINILDFNDSIDLLMYDPIKMNCTGSYSHMMEARYIIFGWHTQKILRSDKNGGRWLKKKNGTCYPGFPYPIYIKRS